MDQAPGATKNALHRTSVRAIGRYPRGRHRAADRSALYWHQARGVRRRGRSRREAGRRRVSLYRATVAAGAAPPRRRRGRSHEEQVSMGLDFKKARGIELLMALWKISDVWLESSAPGTCERNSISNELALAVNPSLVIVRVSTYGQYGKQEYLGRPGYG